MTIWQPTLRMLRWLHLYAGLVLAVPLLLLFVSGVALVYKTDFWRWQHPALAVPLPELAAADHARAISAAQGMFDAPVELVKYPQPDLSAYQVWLADGTEALIDPRTLAVIDHWAWWQRPTAVLAELHLHLFADDTGAQAIGWLGVALALLMISGVIVWWPLKRLFRWNSLVPRNVTRGRMLTFHRNLGVVLLPLTFLLAVTGAAVVFFQPARLVLNGLFGDDASAALAARPERSSPPGTALPLAELLERAERVLPEGRINLVYPDTADTGILMIRKKMPQEAHPNGLSFIHLDRGSGAALRVVDASKAPPGDRIANWIYPLHSAKWGGRTWQAAVAAAGLGLIAMAVSGALAWLRKLPASRRRRSRAAVSGGQAADDWRA